MLKIDQQSTVVATDTTVDSLDFNLLVNDKKSTSILFIKVAWDISLFLGNPLEIISFKIGFSIITNGIPELIIKR